MTENCSPRLAAMRSLISCEDGGRYSNLEINAVLNRSSMSDADRGLYTALVYGVIERTVTLDYIIDSLSSRPVSEIDKETLVALRLGIYQLCFMDKIPPHAAVNESVSLCPKKSRAFANAVLRAFLRAGMKYDLPDRTNLTEHLSVKYSMPRELTAFFLSKYDGDTAEEIMASTLDRQKTTLRINTLKTTADKVTASLAGSEKSELSDEIIYAASAKDAISGIDGGLYFVQDEASFIASKVVSAMPGETVIDTCAAPGGKSFSLAMDMKNTGELYSFDLHRNKLSLIRSGAEKLGISIIKTDRRDARMPDAALIGKADRVLCDAPCSGLGVISKKPDVKYKSVESINALPEIQLAVLSGSAEYVKVGGTLVYSTCTLNPDENEGVVRSFLREHGDFVPVDFEFGFVKSKDGMALLLPHVTGTDGFFIAKMRRVK